MPPPAAERNLLSIALGGNAPSPPGGGGCAALARLSGQSVGLAGVIDKDWTAARFVSAKFSLSSASRLGPSCTSTEASPVAPPPGHDVTA